MADTKLVDLTAGVALDGSELLYAVQTGNDVKITADDIKTYASDGAVLKSDYSPSHSILVQQSGTGSPTALQVGNNTLVGRLSGGGSAIAALSASDVRTFLSINNVDNTSDLSKPISTATQTALDGKLSTSGEAATVNTINGKISAGTNVTLTGTGTTASPYVINASGGGGSAVSGSAVVDFGSYSYATKVSVSDALVTATSKINVSLASPAAGRDDDELEFNPICVAAVAKNGVGFDIYATAPIGADGQFNINYIIGEY
jgi:hypothetical protein